MERVKSFHPEALEKGIETPIILEPFVFCHILTNGIALSKNAHRLVKRER